MSHLLDSVDHTKCTIAVESSQLLCNTVCGYEYKINKIIDNYIGKEIYDRNSFVNNSTVC